MRIAGKLSCRSTMRMMIVSTLPPKQAEARPTQTPMQSAIKPLAAPTPRLMRSPQKIALSMSRPRPSVPSQATVPVIIASPGGSRLSRISTDARSYGLVGEIQGARTAISTIATNTRRPHTASLLSAKSERKRRKGVWSFACGGNASGAPTSIRLISAVVVIP